MMVPNQQASPFITPADRERCSCDECGGNLVHQDKAARTLLRRGEGSGVILEATEDEAICLRLDVEDLRLCRDCAVRLIFDPLYCHLMRQAEVSKAARMLTGSAESGASRVESQKPNKEEEPVIGPTGEPGLGIDGRGGLNAAVITDGKSERVVVHFGPRPLTWVAMTPAEARAFADVLVKGAIELETTPLVADILADEPGVTVKCPRCGGLIYKAIETDDSWCADCCIAEINAAAAAGTLPENMHHGMFPTAPNLVKEASS